VQVPPLQFLMVDGRGHPNTSPAYREAIEALYAVAYGLKFGLKKAGVADWPVMPLEGLWWAEDKGAFAEGTDRSAWQWTMMIAQPDLVTVEQVEQARTEACRRRSSEGSGGLPALDPTRLETYTEGLSAQILYLGAYADEGPTIARLHAWIAEQGYVPHGKHHEIYLGDPRRTAPERLKTILRQPVEPR